MYIVTGGAGFIGSAVVWRLNEMGIDDIVIVDHLDNGEKWRNLVKRRYADYMDRDRFIELARRDAMPWKVEGIVHLGACSSTTETDSGFLMENNFHYSRDLCRYALDHGCRFINASSAATYGAGEWGFDDAPAIVPKLRPLNMYGYSKQLFDLWLLRENLLANVASLKFFNVYGPNEYHKGNMRSVAVKMFQEIKKYGQARLFKSNRPDLADGDQKRDFVHVKDCAALVAWLLLKKPDLGGIRNVGTGVARTFNSLADAVFAAMDLPVKVEYMPMPESLSCNYQNYTQANMAWLREVGYPGQFRDLRDGITDYVRNYLAKADIYL